MKFCDRPFRHAYLSTNGEVWPCSWMHYCIGNLYEQNLDEIWHSKEAEEARASILDGSFAYCRKMSCPFCERGDLPDLSQEEIEARAVASETPLTINVANDYICNIACPSCRTEIYCPQEGEREKIDGALQRLLPIANKAEEVWMNGRGEFLANPSFIQFLQQLRPEEPSLHLSFETNGILFDRVHWEKFSHLSDYDITVTVTLNSLRREVYQFLSGGFDRLDRVLDNLQFMSQLRREGKIHQLCLAMVVQDSNFWEVPEYIRKFTESQEYEVDSITLRPIYKWFGMERDTYWFKDILNPEHPYHQAYLRVLEDSCWQNPKVYDWGCHNIREPMPHPIEQEKLYSRLLLDIYQNKEGLSSGEFLKSCVQRVGGGKIGYYGKNEFSNMLVQMLLEAGVDVAFQLTWSLEDCTDTIPKVAKQEFHPDMADIILLIDPQSGWYWPEDLTKLGFTGPIITAEELIHGTER